MRLDKLVKILVIVVVVLIICVGFLSYTNIEKSNKIHHLSWWISRDTATINNLLEELNNLER